MSAYGYVQTSVGTHGGQRHWIPLELGFQAVVNCPVWVLGTELEFSGTAVVFLSSQPSPQALFRFLKGKIANFNFLEAEYVITPI